jgi:hypothetical protein
MSKDEINLYYLRPQRLRVEDHGVPEAAGLEYMTTGKPRLPEKKKLFSQADHQFAVQKRGQQAIE